MFFSEAELVLEAQLANKRAAESQAKFEGNSLIWINYQDVDK